MIGLIARKNQHSRETEELREKKDIITIDSVYRSVLFIVKLVLFYNKYGVGLMAAGLQCIKYTLCSRLNMGSS
jgi:hypothetical protein